jgi:serine/threonine protein kinase/formylglycine-generating enzyme required for sulfatase activity
MSENQGDPILPIEVLERINQACERFEDAWKKGERPRIEDYLGISDTPAHLELFRELLLLEIDYRHNAGESPSRSEYIQRFPDMLSVIEALDFEPLPAHPLDLNAHPGRIGPYRILGVLGEGGMGVVYAAEQREPIYRRVALKVIKLGMDTKEVVARFEAERQALALLNHPGIAKIHDAGATEDGRPYFVMEHVEGLPLTKYCDLHRLDIRGRLEIFLQVCRGVEHAHHRGILHRDLKPSNSLVSTPDEGPEAKIIDFGVAKATNQRLTEKTLYTEVGRVIGTPAYMSPEQAERTSKEVDHRTDVYSLGVILYELLVGELPLSIDVQKIAFDEIMRRIREEDPPTPSARWTQLNIERTTDLAAKRRASPTALWSELRGDLDWITMKAMEKERERRYGSAAALADDIERFLNKEPVLASPPGAVHRLKKYVWRHRTMVAATTSVILALALGLIASVWSLVGAVKSEKNAQEQTALAQDRLVQVLRLLRLSDVTRVVELQAEADGLWPNVPEKVEVLERWLVRARDLQSRLPAHKALLGELREKALPYDAEARARDRETHPRAAELAALVQSRKKSEWDIAWLEKNLPKDAGATLLSHGPDEKEKHTTYYFRKDFEVEAPEKFAALRFSLLADGAVVYLNGKEQFRENMPEGPIGYGTMAAKEYDKKSEEEYRSHEKASDGSLRKGRNVLAIEVHQASRGSSDLRFDLDVLGVPKDGDAVSLVKKGTLWRYSDVGEDLGEGWRAPAYDEASWKVGPAPLGYGFYGGRGRLLDLKQAVEKLEEKIASLEKEVAVRRTWAFADTEEQWQHDQLSELVEGVEKLCDAEKGLVLDLEKRVEFARSVRKKAIEDMKAGWDEAIASIRNKDECPKYDGLVIAPQLGLIPIGRDRQSGLWEFAHLQTGAIPIRGGEGKLVLAEETSLVFVLIPGGTFRMGAVKPDEKNPQGAPNVDPQAQDYEGPVHEVLLAPFFLSKFEMTQGQWLRFTGKNPSIYGPDSNFGGKQHSLLHPVENVSWEDCQEVLGHLGLVFPTEAQWEYATRAGACTVWWTGYAKETLQGAANLADLFFNKNGGPASSRYENWLDDGYAKHAPVGSFKPNAFGIHDVTGNLFEWCRDWYGSYELPVKAGDGERMVPMAGDRARIGRGGSFDYPVVRARSAERVAWVTWIRNCHLGLRPARIITP